MEPIADEAVELFARFVRDSVEVNAPDESEAARRLVSALTTMLPAAGRMVDHHFRSLLVERARARLRPPGTSIQQVDVAARMDLTTLLSHRPTVWWSSPTTTLAGFGEKRILDPGRGSGPI